jgi:hypothetical protein
VDPLEVVVEVLLDVEVEDELDVDELVVADEVLVSEAPEVEATRCRDRFRGSSFFVARFFGVRLRVSFAASEPLVASSIPVKGGG